MASLNAASTATRTTTTSGASRSSTQQLPAIPAKAQQLRQPVAFRSASPFAPRPAAVRRSQAVVCQAAAAAPAAPTTQAPAQTKYYALVASAEFFFHDTQNESIAEQLRERVRFFKERNLGEYDFWLVPEPTWLDAKYPEQAKKVKRPAVALISTDKQWITFMKVRLDRVLRIDLGPIPASEALAVGGKVPDFGPFPKWEAPFAPYAPGWWEVFVPKQDGKK